jgi:hypothetical protein
MTDQPTAIEQHYVAQGYWPPEGYTWEFVHELRARHRRSAYHVPLCGPTLPCTWGVPAINGKRLRRPTQRNTAGG